MNERIVSHVLGLSFLLSVILAGGCMSSPPEKTEMQGTPSEIMIKNISVDDYSVKGENEQNFSEVPQRVIAIGMEEQEEHEHNAGNRHQLFDENRRGPCATLLCCDCL